MICWFSKKMVRTSCTYIKKQKLLLARFASSRNILNNFTELGDIMEKNELAGKPNRISNVDEKGIFHFTLTTAVTSLKSSTTNIIRCGRDQDVYRQHNFY